MWKCLDEFETHLHAEPKLPPLMNIAALHYEFEAIRRLLVVLLLVEWGRAAWPGTGPVRLY